MNSIPDRVLIKRLNDNAAAWSGGNNTRFSSNNECDFILFDDNTGVLYGLELKSTIGSLTYWREDFENPLKEQTFQIRKCQIQGLKKWSKHKGVFGFIFNFRQAQNQTFFVSIIDFLSYTSTLSKKSINIKDVFLMNPLKIESRLMRKYYKYNIEDFLGKSM